MFDFDYGNKDTAVFPHFQILFNFLYFFSSSAITPIYRQISRFACVPLSPCFPLVLWRPVFRWCVFLSCVLWWCVRWSPDNHTHAHTYARIYARARGFLDHKFLDHSVIFRRIGIFSFFLPIGIFRAQTAIFRLQKHKFSIKSKILFGYSIFMLTFAIENNKYTKQ